MDSGMMNETTRAMRYVRSRVDDVDAYMQLAEEAAELSAIAAKMARYIKGTNPCAVDSVEITSRVTEETGDVLVCLLVCHLIESPGLLPDAVEDWLKHKTVRWAERLSEQEKVWWEDECGTGPETV